MPDPLPACVINADDLGGSSTVNQAVIRSLETGLVTSATIMSTMPAFAEACAMVHGSHTQDRIGVHLNLSQGEPITDPIRRCPRLSSPDGRFRPRLGTVWRLSSDEARAIDLELSAQVDAVLAAGITPSHLDSHHHVHTQWPIGSVVIDLARRYRIPAVRLTRNCGPGIGLLKRTYKSAFNARLRRSGLAWTDLFGSASDVAHVGASGRALEIMTHPDLDADGRIVDLTTAAPLADVARDWAAVSELVSYADLCRR